MELLNGRSMKIFLTNFKILVKCCAHRPNGVKHPAKRQIARVSSARACMSSTHVLLDYENVQPSDSDLRLMVPDASQVWVFHGPQQRKIEERFASFGAGVTDVPISKSGKNALDFHLSF